MNTESVRSFPPRIKYLWMCVLLLRVHRAKCRLREYRPWQTRFYYLRDIFMNIYFSLCCVEWLSCLLRNRGLHKHNNDINVWVGCEWSASLILLQHDHTTEKNNKVNTFTQLSDYSILILLTLEFLMLSLLYTINLPPPRFGPSHASGRPRCISDSIVLKIPPHQHDSLHSLTTSGRRYESTCHTPGD